MLYALNTSDLQFPQLRTVVSCPKLVNLLMLLESTICRRMVNDIRECEIIHSHTNGECGDLLWQLRKITDENELNAALSDDPGAPSIDSVATYIIIKGKSDDLDGKITYVAGTDF